MLSVARLCLIVLLFQHIGICYADNQDDLDYQQALSSADAGHYKKALDLLRPLANKYPKPNRYFYDFLSVLAWAGEYQQITQYEKDINIQQAPRYVLNNLAVAFRQQKLFDKSQKMYQVMSKRFPEFLDAQIGLTLVLIDQNKIKQAQEKLLPLYQKYPKNIDVLNAVAYFYESKKAPLQALSVYEQILALKPTDTTTFKKKVLTLNALGASHLAYSLISDPTVFSNEELARIRADMAAHRVRWGTIPVDNEQNRFDETEQAIDEIEKNNVIAQKNLGEQHPLTLTNQFDLLIALRNRYRMQEVLALDKELGTKNIAIPNYAKHAVCDAFLYEQRPQPAIDCYTQIIDSGYSNISAKTSLFYAYLENENYTEAQLWIEKLAAQQASLIKGVGKKKVIKPNPKKLQTETVKSLGIAFGDYLEDAERQFQWLNNNAPYNLDLRKEMANVYYWRGWPRKAQQEYEIGLHQTPKHLGLRLGQARNWLALREYQKAGQSISELYQIYPEDKGIASQKRLWDIHNMREFRTKINSSDSSGSNVNGSRGLDIDSYLFSSPINDNYRAYLHQRHSQAKFEEGDGQLNHLGMGVEYRAPDLVLAGELHHNNYEDNRAGISVFGQYEFDDYLSSAVTLESLSRDTPLRALNQGIYAKSAAIATQYRWNESRSVGLNLSYLDFSDSNKRKSIGGFWKERWYNRYNHKFSTRVDLFSSNNSEKDTIYFNPDRDFSGSIALDNDWLTWREYDNAFYQRLVVSTGFYNQQHFDTGNTWGLQYEHRWLAQKRFELLYGLKRGKNRYDGDDEYQWDFYAALNWKF
jgi:biofilm PGA synthesis protein PgaA